MRGTGRAVRLGATPTAAQPSRTDAWARGAVSPWAEAARARTRAAARLGHRRVRRRGDRLAEREHRATLAVLRGGPAVHDPSSDAEVPEPPGVSSNAATRKRSPRQALSATAGQPSVRAMEQVDLERPRDVVDAVARGSDPAVPDGVLQDADARRSGPRDGGG